MVCTPLETDDMRRFGSTVGQFVLTASLRAQVNPENKDEFKEVSPERCVVSWQRKARLNVPQCFRRLCSWFHCATLLRVQLSGIENADDDTLFSVSAQRRTIAAEDMSLSEAAAGETHPKEDYCKVEDIFTCARDQTSPATYRVCSPNSRYVTRKSARGLES